MVVFQNYAVWPHMKVYNNIVYGLKIPAHVGWEQEPPLPPQNMWRILLPPLGSQRIFLR
jgi:ABC-type taurine transport system ATPase subunit